LNVYPICMKAKYKIVTVFAFLIFYVGCSSYSRLEDEKKARFIQISGETPSYFQLSDGSPYIPIGINMINPSGKYGNTPDSAFYEIDQWMKNLSENGGNYIRVWLSQSYWDIEDSVAGMYSEKKAQRIDRFIAMARKYGLRIKMTLEHFRSVTLEENPQSWATKYVYHTSHGGPLDSIRQYLISVEGQKLFIDKLDYYQKRYGSDTLFFGWELWNEMNAMRGPEDSIFFAWNEKMLRETKQRFPENLVMQSLGSFDAERTRETYRRMMLMPENEIAQIHRYLDLGAPMEICQAPMDVICSTAIEELLSYHTGKPMILAETGAVEPRHSGPSKYYPLDTAGILLHDVLFAPFFSGSAGAGMCWHWGQYVHANNLWFHFGRFSHAIRGINPIIENFVPKKLETEDLRIYYLEGKTTTMVWLRDKQNTWRTELDAGQPPRELAGINVDLQQLGLTWENTKIAAYDPWTDRWKDLETDTLILHLPTFKRSLVVKVQHN